jgi:hypothetical protein
MIFHVSRLFQDIPGPCSGSIPTGFKVPTDGTWATLGLGEALGSGFPNSG